MKDRNPWRRAASLHRTTSRRLVRLERLEPRCLLASVSGQLLYDLDADGVLKTAGGQPENGEFEIRDWRVFVDGNGNRQFDEGERNAITDNDGRYSLGSLSAGTYAIEVQLRSGWQQTYPTGGTGHQVTVSASDTVTGIDFGVTRGAFQPFTAGNLLVTRGSFLTHDLLLEYTPQGELVQALVIPGSEGYSRVIAKDLVVDALGRGQIFNGYDSVRLTTFDPLAATFANTSVPDWDMGRTFNDWGDIAAFGDWIFANEHVDNSGTADGVIRFDAGTLSYERFSTGFGKPTDLTVGRDGLLYTLEASVFETTVRVHDPESMSAVRSFVVPERLYSVAVDRQGNLYATTDTGLKHYDAGGTLVKSTLQADGADIYLTAQGTLVLADWNDIQTCDTAFQTFTTFDIPGNATNNLTAFATVANDDLETLIVTRFVPTDTGFVAQFSRDLEPGVLNLYDSAAQTLGPADVTVTGATGGPVLGSLVLSADRRQITFVQTGGLLEPDTYTVTLFSGATRFRQPSGGTLDGNADGTPGDNYQTTFTVAARLAGTVTISLPDFARGAAQSVNIPNASAGLPIRLSAAAGVTSLAVDVRYDPALLNITAATRATGIPADWSVTLDTGTAGVAKITASGTTALSGTNVDVVRLTAAVPGDAPYGAIQAIRLENLALNGGAIAAVGDVAVHKAVYLGDADGSGIHSSADAFLTVQAALGLASGFAAHAWTDPLIVGDADGSGVLSAADAFLIVQEGLGLSEPFVPDNPHIAVTPVGGGVDPQFLVGENLPASVGGSVAVPVKLDIEPAATNVGAFDFDLFFDPAKLTIQLPVGVSAGADTAGWAVTAKLVEPGHLRVGMVSATGQPLVPGLREIARLQFRVEPRRTGWQPVPDGLPTRPTLLPPITDVSDGSETHPTWLDIEPVDARAGGYTWTDADGSVLIRPVERNLAGAARERLWRDVDAKADLLESVLEDLVHEIASAWQ